MKHGTHAAYRAGCHCAECRDANRAYQRAWYHKHHGPSGIMTDAAEAARHCRFLVEVGDMTAKSLALMAGVSTQVISDLLRGESNRIHKDTANAILGIGIGDCCVPGPKQFVPKDATIRLLDEMVAWGIPVVAIRAAIKTRPHQVRARKRVHKRTHDKTVLLYRYLAGKGLVPADVLEEVGA
jgi:hypothetical protein